MKRRKPTRRDLLIVIGQLQEIFGFLSGATSDRNPNRMAQLVAGADAGLNRCIEALGMDPPIFKPTGPWANFSHDYRDKI